MKKNLLTKLFALMLVLCTLFLNSCSVFTNVTDKSNSQDNVATNDGTTNNTEISNGTNDTIDDNNVSHVGRLPEGAYNEGVVLVKVADILTDALLAGLNYTSFAPLYEGAKWYSVMLGDSTNAKDAVAYLSTLEGLEGVDYDYIMSVGETTSESVEVSGNPYYESDQKKQHKTQGVDEAWKYLKSEGMNPGGSSDVIVAVIDTGVDYNHLDLRNNIWINPAEIPNNGVDDDGNGYIDDVRGWDCVGDDNDPMDDNGHGTHVAGIIAAENNKIGGVGIAYNCKVMVLKAGNSSGHFNNSDIAEAIQYAYMNGADVINMSFGGSQISFAVEDALENAYNSCILVAAAGNYSMCNQPRGFCTSHPDSAPFYPAALTYVIGVMSVNTAGNAMSSFSNFDHVPYNKYEYDVYATGEQVNSCWPNNQYATLSGTSMAAPMVSGMVALLRSYYSDRELYSTKYIQSQIVNAGGGVVNAYEALTKTPTPKVSLYDCRIDDSALISTNNNENGIIDAGETIRLYVSLHNRGGVASNLSVSIDSTRNDDTSLIDPYFTFLNTELTFSDIGTYSVREAYEDEYFEIVVDSKCPNDYGVNFNIRFTYNNGMNENDHTNYSGEGIVQSSVSNGYHLSGVISEDTVFTADKLYIISGDVVIPSDVTVTFEEGCQIQFYDYGEYYESPKIRNFGVLNLEGTKNETIKIRPCEWFDSFACMIENSGFVNINYAESTNLLIYGAAKTATAKVMNSILNVQNDRAERVAYIAGGYVQDMVVYNYEETAGYTLHNCFIDLRTESALLWNASLLDGCYVLLVETNNRIGAGNYSVSSAKYGADFYNNVILTFRSETFPGLVREMNIFAFENNRLLSMGSQATMKFADFSKVSNNYFSPKYQQFASQIIQGYYDANGRVNVDVYGSCSDISKLWPHVVSVELFDKNGEPINTVGVEEIKVRVTFNRPMDKDAGTFLTFGTIEPYGDYRIDGEYISDTVWEGTYTLKAQIENGQNYLKVNNAWAAEDQTKTVFGEYQLHEFTIDTTAAMAMNLIANPKPEGIELTWAQDDYDTLMGYNIYRSESKDGNFVKINPSILLDTDSTFIDTNAEPGKTYWYTFTVVLSDFTESNPAGKVQATAVDTIAPNIYHTPVNQGYLNNNLIISCTASDNIAIETLTLYYRAVDATEWKALTMSKHSDKFSAKIYGNELTLAGIEYYIVASDGRNTINKGSAEAPYTVIIKDASAISRKGDVDGDGVVTTKDALMLMQCLNDDIILKDDEFQRADLNGDGSLSSAEALRILQYINGKINTLEM